MTENDGDDFESKVRTYVHGTPSYLACKIATRLQSDKNFTLPLIASIAGTNSSDDDVQSIVELLRSFPVVGLELNDNRITDNGALMLCSELHRHQALSMINLSGNPITDRSAIAFSKLIPNHSGLATVEFDSTEITELGAVHLAIAAQRSNSLTSLSFIGCGICQTGMRALAAAKRARPALDVFGVNFTGADFSMPLLPKSFADQLHLARGECRRRVALQR